MDTMAEFGLDTKVTGIQNAMVAQCAWFLDGHIQALRNHWQRKIEEAEKKCEAQLITIKGKLGCLQEELEAVEKERDELRRQKSELLKERLAPQAIEYVKNGVPLDRFNEVVMELSKMRDERDALKEKSCSHMVCNHCELPTTDNQRDLQDRLRDAENCIADVYALSLCDNLVRSCLNIRDRINTFHAKLKNDKNDVR